AATTGMFFLFWKFLRTGDRKCFWASAALGGLAWSCKFTTVLVPPILGLVWWVERLRGGDRGAVRVALAVVGRMAGFVAATFVANAALTGFETLPLSTTSGIGHPSLDAQFGPTRARWLGWVVETPIPQDWVGFTKQVWHQRSGGPSYLCGERRATGW